MKSKCFIGTLILTCFLISAKGQFVDFNFIQISVDQGLSQNSVFCILQDKKGFLWFGTQDGGLNKYDGYNFTTYPA